MNPQLRYILGIVAGFATGLIINMGIIMLGSNLIPLPGGADGSSVKELERVIPLLEPKHFIFPFTAHALGTLSGAFVAALINYTKKRRSVLIVGILFFAGGLSNFFMIPSPVWFIWVDLILAYIPFAIIGEKMVTLLKGQNQ